MTNATVYITEHAQKRLKKRYGLNKGSSQRIANRAFLDGIHFKRTKGALNTYIMEIYNKYEGVASNIKIYNQFVFLFRRNRLITVYHLPQKYHKYLDQLIEERDKHRQIKNENNNNI